MIIRKHSEQTPFTTKDGSTITSLLDSANAPVKNQSLAEARIPSGGSTQRHYHRDSEEFYYISSGSGLMEIDGESREIGVGDAILIPPGAWHGITATTDLSISLLLRTAIPARGHFLRVKVRVAPAGSGRHCRSLMKILKTILFLGILPVSAQEEKPGGDLYELRSYHAIPGKLDTLLARFRDHTCRLFEKHGMTNVGYWVPPENPDGMFVYIRSFPDMRAREKSTASFRKDPEWHEARDKSQEDGKLIKNIDSVFMKKTDFSHDFSISGEDVHLFEMRTYIATPGNLDALHARFRDHTLALFEKHGMINLGYFELLPDQPGAEDTLIYFIAHKDMEAAKKSWAAFGADSEWIAAKKASEEKAGGSLTEKGGVKSVFLKPTDFSPLK